MAHKLIIVDNTEIRFFEEGDEDYISLTDIARKFNDNTGQAIMNWLRVRATIHFLGAWESLHNPNFNVLEFEQIKSSTGDNTFFLTSSAWAERTAAIGVRSKTGRYGGTFGHKDIAFEFLSYLSPTFKLYVFKEFQRLKKAEAENSNGNLEWSVNRTFAKLNYQFHADAIKTHLIPPLLDKRQSSVVYASEGDLLNVALFGITAKQWQSANPDLKGNIRDYASTEQLLVLANMENLNAYLIKQGLSQDERLHQLNAEAIQQVTRLLDLKSITSHVKELAAGQ